MLDLSMMFKQLGLVRLVLILCDGQVRPNLLSINLKLLDPLTDLTVTSYGSSCLIC